MLLQMAGYPPFSWLPNIPLKYASIYHFLFYPLVHWWAFRLFPHLGYCEQCYNKYRSVYSSSKSCSHFLWVYIQKWNCWVVWGNSILFPQQLHQFTFPSTVYEDSLFTTSWAIPVFIYLLDDGNSKCVRWYLTGFDMHFPDDQGCWALFHVPIGHFDVFFGKFSI